MLEWAMGVIQRYKRIFKMVGLCVCAFIIGMFIGFIRLHISDRRSGHKFDICQGYSFVSGGYDDTSIHVIVNSEEYDIESMVDEVRNFHNTLNGEADKLEINLYNSRNDWKSGACKGSKVYYKD